MKTSLAYAVATVALVWVCWTLADSHWLATDNARLQLALESEQLRSDSLLTALRASRCNGYTYAQHNGGKGGVLAFTHYQTRPVSIEDGRFADSMYHALAPSVAYEDSLHAPK